MLDMASAIQSRARIVLCGSAEEALAFKSAGFRSVRIVTRAEDVMVLDSREPVSDPSFDAFDDIILAYGQDQSELRDAIAARLDDTKCRWIDWAAHGGGVCRQFEMQGIGGVVYAVGTSRPMWIDEVCLLSDVPDGGTQRVFMTGIDGLDNHGFRIVRPAFWPIIGPYASGKSVLVRQLACNLYRLHGWKVLITSFEEKIKPRYQRDLRQHLIGADSADANGVLSWERKFPALWTSDDIAKADDKIEDGFRFLRRKRGASLDMGRLIDRIEYAVRVYGVDVVIIDPVNEVDHHVPRGESKTDYMGRFMIALKQLADDYSLIMIVLAHPPKEGVEKRSTKGRILTLNDGADTAHYGNKADIGWCVWRPKCADDGPTYLNIDKLKDHDVMGKPTLAKLMLNKLTGGFAVSLVGYDAVLDDMMGE